jgi:cysteinyl-tRNA synthetase
VSGREFAGLKEAFEELLGEILGFDLSKDQTIYAESIPTGERFGQPTLIRLRRGQEKPSEEVLERVVSREGARQEKNWALADRLRDELNAEGWIVEDTSEGPILSRR